MPVRSHVPTEEDLTLVDQIARSVARSRRLRPQDIDDFAQTVQVRMAARNYHALRRFEGRSSLRTYLTVVTARMLKDWQNHEFGKWRPSAAAVRSGATAVEIDRLLHRDGRDLEEGIRIVAARTGTPEADLRRVAESLPRRSGRRLVPIELIADRGVRFVDPVEQQQVDATASAARSALGGAFGALPPEDARLLMLRFVRHRTVRSLALEAGLEPKALYRRFERILKTVRHRLHARGISHPIDAN